MTEYFDKENDEIPNNSGLYPTRFKFYIQKFIIMKFVQNFFSVSNFL